MENQASTQPSKGSGKTVLFVIIALLALLNGVLAWMLIEEKEVVETQQIAIEDLEQETSQLEQDLQEMLAQYDELETESDSLRADLAEERARIEDLLQQVQKYKGDRYMISKYKKEAETLREIMKGYVHTIDSLNTLNIALREEKDVLDRELGQQRTITRELSKEKENLEETVRIGARMRALDIAATAQRVKKNNVHRETTRAEKAEKVRCCFTIDKNEITPPGKRSVYMRIVDPDGNVLALSQDKSQMTSFNGVEGLYSTAKEIDYQNEELDVCIYWEVLSQIPPGTYIVELYADELDIGSTSFELK